MSKACKIIVPIDFSNCSVNAMLFAIKLLDPLHADLILFHALQVPEGGDAAFFFDEKMVEAEKKKAYGNIRNLIDSIKDIRQYHVETQVNVGDVNREILDLARKKDASLIVIGTKGSSNRIRDILGTTANYVIHHAHCGVITVPEEAGDADLKHIAMGTDLQDYENIALPTLVKHIAKSFKAKVSIVHVTNAEAPATDHEQKSSLIMALSKKFESIDHEFKLVKGDRVAQALEEFGIEEKLGLMAIIPKKDSKFSQLFSGSVSRNLALHSQIPLLTCLD